MREPDPILYAEDSDDDVFLLQRAFIRAQLPQPLVTVRDGRAAIQYLQSALAPTTGPKTAKPLPGLVLLDVKMPFLSGIEVLKWIREQPQLAHLPVLMLSSSADERDVAPAFSAGANGYLLKPGSLDALDSLVAGLREALEKLPDAPWGTIAGARFPSDGASGGP